MKYIFFFTEEEITKINDKFEVRLEKLEKNMVIVTIINASKDLEGKYSCLVNFTKKDNKKDFKEVINTFYHWDRNITINFGIYDTKDKHKKIDIVKIGDSFVIDCSADVGKVTEYAIVLLHQESYFGAYFSKGT